MSAILFGSISTLADTSELQRRALNDAFEEHGLDWHWDREEYRGLITSSGGAQRIADRARELGQDVDARAVHQTKSELFQKRLAESGVQPRPGVVETIREGRDEGFKIALVTTTAEANVDALVQALDPELGRDDFDLLVDASAVEQPKPDGAVYIYALDALGEAAADCIAIEDNLGGVQAAREAGLICTAFPNENTAAHEFDKADQRVDRLSFADLRAAIPNG